MIERQESSFLSEMEKVKSLMKLTPEERKMEVRRQIYVKLKAVEMERRQRVALETREKCKREREEMMRQEAKQREEEEEEMRANEQKALEEKNLHQLKIERLQWKKVMLVEEEPVKRPSYTISALKEEQQRRREEAELCRPPKMGHKASPECLTSALQAEPQGKRTTVHNNWVGGQEIHSEPLEKSHPNHSTYHLFAAKSATESEDKPKTPKSNETLQWLQERLYVEYWVDKYRDRRVRKKEKRTLKAEENYARWTAFKLTHASQFSRQYDWYTGEKRNRGEILKSIF